MFSHFSNDQQIIAGRYFLKDEIRQEVNFFETDQNQGRAAPPLQKPYAADSVCLSLPDGPEALAKVAQMSIAEAIMQRQSARDYQDDALSSEELSALLWASQGVRRVLSPFCALRTVPSAGARHAFETYLAIARVEGIPSGLYRYLPFEGKLLQLRVEEGIGQRAAQACLNQHFVARAAVTLFWTAIPARMEWRYGAASHKVIALDAGHVCENLYLAATAMGIGTCAIAAYQQQACDELLAIDGRDEFTVYIAPLGKTKVATQVHRA